MDAVIRNFLVIGEASKNVPDKIKNKYSDIDWKGIAGFRNRIAHAYFEISPSIVWYIIKNDLPALKARIKKILEE
ncbi:MAG: HepT-like ribonuclease domain-containing protein [Nitrososphaeria archaeon]